MSVELSNITNLKKRINYETILVVILNPFSGLIGSNERENVVRLRNLNQLNRIKIRTIMKENVLKFQSDIKAEVAYCKEHGDHRNWMHPIYCAYYILKHGVEDEADKYIDEDIKRSHKVFQNPYLIGGFKNLVKKSLEKYAAKETVCADSGQA